MESERIIGELKVLQALSEYEYGVEIWVLREGLNRNKWYYENVDKYYQTFVGVPILIAYRNMVLTSRDVGDGHNMSIRIDPKTGEKYYSFTDATSERIVGTVSDDPNDVRLEVVDGKTWIVAKGRIFRFYAKELVDKIIEAGTMEVSTETEILESRVDDAGVEYMENWLALGITILGDGVAPAIPGARIAALAAMREEFTELKLRAASLREGESPDAEKPEGQVETPPDGPAEEDGGVKNNSDNKGVNKRMNFFNKTQLAALADKFTGWVVVCAAKDDDGIHVGLRDDKGGFGRYTMASENETFAPERVEKIAVNADFGGGLTCDVGEITDRLFAENAANAALLESAIAERDAKDAEIATLRENEASRRLEDCKNRANTTLSAFNRNRENKVEASVLDAVMTDIDNGLYANSLDADGKWAGEAAVEMRVKALCADAVAAQDRKLAENSRRSYIWETPAANGEADNDGSLGAMVRNYNAGKNQ